MDIPGVGPLRASDFVASVAGPTVQARLRPGRLDRARAQAELIGREGPARQHNTGWQPIPPADAGGRRDGGDPVCGAAWHEAALAGPTARAEACQGRCGGAGEQECAHGLGVDDQRRTLSRAAADRGVEAWRGATASKRLERAQRS